MKILQPKYRRRSFSMGLFFVTPWINQWAKEVIESIHKKEIKVFCPDDRDAFAVDYSLREEPDLEVHTLEWLPVMCQAGYWTHIEKDTFARYQHNAKLALFPLYEAVPCKVMPPGPAAFCGCIEVNMRHQFNILKDKEIDNESLFKGLWGHELAHALRLMPFVVPAFLDWRTYWRIACDAGGRIDTILRQAQIDQDPIDSYHEEEFLELCRFWHEDMVKPWWDALCEYRVRMSEDQEEQTT